MPDLKLVVWNMEWLNDLFVADNGPAAFKADGTFSPNFHLDDVTVASRRQDLVGVLNELAPDIVVVVEGPNRPAELQLFFDQPQLAGDWQATVQPTPKQSQCIGIATRIDQGKFNAPAFTSLAIPGADPFAPFELDTDDDGIAERYHFERRPLYVEVSPSGAAPFRILGLHLKSKGIFKAFEWSQWWQVADANRRKILAQAGQIRRQFLDQYMTDAATRDIPLIVCGDINDGPGLDASEKRLFGSGIERLMGSIWKPNLCLSNALFDALPPDDQASLAFDKIVTTNFKDPIFNNTWHNEWIDHLLHTHAQAGWVTNARTHGQMQNGPIWREYRFASDHYPVSATLTV
jgi:endonuclease/exonuclease/phosphatase family metal-dependent hydrolase